MPTSRPIAPMKRRISFQSFMKKQWDHYANPDGQLPFQKHEDKFFIWINPQTSMWRTIQRMKQNGASNYKIKMYVNHWLDAILPDEPETT